MSARESIQAAIAEVTVQYEDAGRKLAQLRGCLAAFDGEPVAAPSAFAIWPPVPAKRGPGRPREAAPANGEPAHALPRGAIRTSDGRTMSAAGRARIAAAAKARWAAHRAAKAQA